MKDILLEQFFQYDRWVYAIEKSVGKGIDKFQLLRLTSPECRVKMCEFLQAGMYEIAPPHTAEIPKDNGEFRTVFVNEAIDRVVLSITNDLLFELCSDMRHPRCQSYLKGVGCGKIVREVSKKIWSADGDEIGWKADLSKYFDSVPIEYIDRAFDEVECRHGHSALIDMLRKYYHSDWYFDSKGNLKEMYQSLKQGCSVASWLADVVLYHVDEKLSKLDGYYIRYSDDMLFIGKDKDLAMKILTDELAKMGMKLNPKKVEMLSSRRWFKFLGYSIRGQQISLSSTRIKKFQREIEKRTVKNRNVSFRQAVNSVNRFLYQGAEGFSWATQILPVCNVEKDLLELDKFVLDCLRAVKTNKRKVGGLGYSAEGQSGCVLRGKGKNVSANRQKFSDEIDGYLTIACMRKALNTSREVYLTLVSQL